MPSDKPVHSEWFRDWFNEDYTLVYGHRSDEEAENFVAQWPVWDEKPVPSCCLDLGCGGGRFSRAIARRGVKTIGLDLSNVLLRNAFTAPPSTASPMYVRADIRRPPFRGSFGLIVSLFTSFGYFKTDSEHIELLNTIGRLLEPDGLLILDLPNCKSVINIDNAKGASRRTRVINGTKVVEAWKLIDNSRRVEKEILIGKGASIRRYRESVRLFSAEELLQMTSSAGFDPYCDFWGDYQGGPLMETSSRMIYFGRKRG